MVAITAGADASAATNGSAAGASGGEKDARTVGHYYKGMAVFTIAKGGLMYQAAVSGQKFSYQAALGELIAAGEQRSPILDHAQDKENKAMKKLVLMGIVAAGPLACRSRSATTAAIITT